MLICPAFVDVFVGCEAFQSLQSLGEVVCCHEVGEMLTQLIVGLAVEVLDRCFLDRPVHPLDLPVGPEMPWLGRPVIDIVPGSGIFEGVRPEALAIGHGLPDQRDGRSAAAGRGDAFQPYQAMQSRSALRHIGRPAWRGARDQQVGWLRTPTSKDRPKTSKRCTITE